MDESKWKNEETPKAEIKFGTEEMVNLNSAISLLDKLEIEVIKDGNKIVGWEKLRHAKKYLEDLQRKLLADPDSQNK